MKRYEAANIDEYIAGFPADIQQLLDKKNPDVYAYTRTGEGERMLVLLNFTAHAAKVSTGLAMNKTERLLSNYGAAGNTMAGLTLRPYECLIYKLPL